MAYIRATRKVLSRLPSPVEPPEDQEETALGDWYVNRVVVDRRPLLLLVSSKSLLPIVTPARNVRGLPEQLPGLVERRLRGLEIDAALVAAEVRAVAPVYVAPTSDRSVVGILTEFCFMVRYYIGAGNWGESALLEAERKLADTPCFAGRKRVDTVWPARKAVELMWRHWSAP